MRETAGQRQTRAFRVNANGRQVWRGFASSEGEALAMAERYYAGRREIAIETCEAVIETCEVCGGCIREDDARAVDLPVGGGWAEVCGRCNARGVWVSPVPSRFRLDMNGTSDGSALACILPARRHVYGSGCSNGLATERGRDPRNVRSRVVLNDGRPEPDVACRVCGDALHADNATASDICRECAQ